VDTFPTGNTPGMWESIGNIWEDVDFGGGFRLFGLDTIKGGKMNMSPVDYWEQFRHATGGCHPDTSGEPHGIEEIEGGESEMETVFVEYPMDIP